MYQRRSCVLTIVSLGIAMLLSAGCDDGGGGSLSPALMTTEEKSIAREATGPLKLVRELLDITQGPAAEVSSGGQVFKAASSGKWMVSKSGVLRKADGENIDATVSLRNENRNASGTIRVVGTGMSTETENSLSLNAQVTITLGPEGIRYTDPQTGDWVQLELAEGGIDLTLRVSASGSVSAINGTAVLSVAYSNLLVTAEIDGKPFTATMSESWTQTVNIAANPSAFQGVVTVTGYTDIDFESDGVPHTVRIDLQLTGQATAVSGDEQLTFKVVEAIVFLTVDGVLYEYTAEEFELEFGIDYAIDGSEVDIEL